MDETSYTVLECRLTRGVESEVGGKVCRQHWRIIGKLWTLYCDKSTQT